MGSFYYVLIMFSQILGSPGGVGVPEQELNQGTITNTLNVVYSIAGSVAVIVIIIGGILLSVSSGDSGKAAKGRNAILYASIGLVVVASAFAITNYVVDKL